MSFKFLFTNNYSKVILQQGIPQKLSRVINGANVQGLVMPDFEKIANRQHDESYVQDEDLRTTVVPGTGPNIQAMEEQAKETSSDVAQELGFDANAGRQELYNSQRNAYLKEYFSKKGFSNRRFKKAMEYFDNQFEKDWKAGEQTRRNEYMAQQREPLLAQKIEQNDAKVRQLEQTHDYDAETNSWKKKLAPKLKTAGLNFGSVRDVQTWLTNNGFDTKGIDNMYGANTKAAIDKLLSDTVFGLTDEEKQKFRDFQNSSTFYRAKVRTPDSQPFKVSDNTAQTVSNAPTLNLGLSTTPVTLGLTGSYKDYNRFIAPGFGPNVERKEGDLYVDGEGNLVSSIPYNPKNTNQTPPKKEGTIYTADYLKQSKNFRGRHGLDQQVLINGKHYPVLVTRDILSKEEDPYEDINDWSYAYDEEAGKILRLNEMPILNYGTTNGMDTSRLKWVDVDEFVQDPLKFYGRKKNGGTINKYKQGNKMNNQEELQKAFMAYLIEDAAANGVQIQSEQDLQAYAQQLGEEGLKVKYQEFMQKMQGGAKAALGAKLNYIRKIKGMCPDGQETYFFKEGGSIKSGCKPCMDKAKNGQELQKKGNAVQQFKNRNINPNDTVWADGDKNKARTLTDDRNKPLVKGMKPYSAAEYQRDLAKGRKGDKSAARRVEKQDEKTMYGCGGKSKKKKN